MEDMDSGNGNFRRCRTCKKEKAISEFQHRVTKGRNRPGRSCKACVRACRESSRRQRLAIARLHGTRGHRKTENLGQSMQGLDGTECRCLPWQEDTINMENSEWTREGDSHDVALEDVVSSQRLDGSERKDDQGKLCGPARSSFSSAKAGANGGGDSLRLRGTGAVADLVVISLLSSDESS